MPPHVWDNVSKTHCAIWGLDVYIASNFKSTPLAIFEFAAIRITAIAVAMSSLFSTDLEVAFFFANSRWRSAISNRCDLNVLRFRSAIWASKLRRCPSAVACTVPCGESPNFRRILS